MTDDLAGLANRRRLMGNLATACGGGSAQLVALFDLDGFKDSNDTHGHPSGDKLLQLLASRMSADVTVLVGHVAAELGMHPDEVDDVFRAAELHDVGKLAIPREILDKPGPLDDAEWEVMRRHTIIGERTLKAAPAMAAIAPLVRSSHERWDGGGYPDGLAGTDIALGARIVAVCDSFDAMVSDRVYRRGMRVDEALEELRRCAGTQFDPDVVAVFVRLAGDAMHVREQPMRRGAGIRALSST